MDTIKIENLRNLAQSAMEAGSYKDAYKYSQSILDVDPTLDEIWLIKAISAAGLMANSDDINIEEVIFCLDRGAKEAELSTIKMASTIINESYKEIIKRLDATLNEKIIDHHKVPMPNGGSAFLHRTGQLLYASGAAKDLAPKRLKAIKLLEKSYSLNSSKDNLKLLMDELASFLSHSSKYGDYLEKENEINSYILSLISELKTKAEEFGIQPATPPKKQSGCFIATAATGSYDHPKVIKLRLFRDNILKNYILGRIFINYYYKISPPIANLIESSNLMKQIVLCLVVNPLSNLANFLLNKNKI